MLGFRYLKVPPTTYVLHYRGGQLAHEGPGLSFWYFAPMAEIIQVPLASADVQFVFNEVTSDFQEVTLQGELTYRVVEPKKIADALDHSVTPRGAYRTQDPQRVAERLTHAGQVIARAFTQAHPLRELLVSSDGLRHEMLAQLERAPEATSLGVAVMGLSILALKPTPDMAKALQAEAREELLRKADDAVYARRNAAVEMERRIKESELNTEIAVEQKRRQVRETQMAAEVAVEQQRAGLVEQRVENERKEADARAHALRVTLEPLKSVDWRTLLAVGGGADAGLNIALAFRELAENAGKIGEVNISPDLLATLLRRGKTEPPPAPPAGKSSRG
jgi:hypothetical protein